MLAGARAKRPVRQQNGRPTTSWDRIVGEFCRDIPRPRLRELLEQIQLYGGDRKTESRCGISTLNSLGVTKSQSSAVSGSRTFPEAPTAYVAECCNPAVEAS